MQLVIKLFVSGKRCRSTASSIGELGVVCILLLLLRNIAIASSEDPEYNEKLNMTALDKLRLKISTNYDNNLNPTNKGELTNEKWNMTALDKLRLQLFTNYDKNLHPTNKGEPTNITLGLTINYIDVDEMNGKMTLHAWLKIRWIDETRSWNASEYDNIKTIHTRPGEVWKPDLTLFNSAGEGSSYIGDTQLILMQDGGFLWVPPTVFTAYCNLNLLMWPFDSQTCDVKIGTWTMTNIDARYLKESESLDYEELVQSTEWEIINASSSFHRKDYHNYVQFSFELERRSSMYTAVIFTPASCIVLLALSTFWLPPQMGEKILLNGIVIVVISAFLMYFAQLLPVLAENTPLVVLFYSSCLLLVSISTIIAVIVLYISTAKHKRRVPDFLKNILNGFLGKVLCLSQFSLESEPQSLLNNGTKELTEHVYDNPDNENTDPLSINPMAAPSTRSIQFDWILLATAVDRICFLCYCVIFIGLAVTYSI